MTARLTVCKAPLHTRFTPIKADTDLVDSKVQGFRMEDMIIKI